LRSAQAYILSFNFSQQIIMTSEIRKQFAKPFMWLVILFGVVAIIFTISKTTFGNLGVSFLIFAVVTLIFGSRIIVQIPRVKGQISISDTFVLLAILVFGGEAGVILAGADALYSSLRISKKPLVIAFNTGVFIFSTFLTVITVRYFFGSIVALTEEGFTSQYIVALCLMGFTQYFANSGLVAAGVALRAGESVWKMWRDNFLWTSITYFAGASTAGIIAQLIEQIGLLAFLAATPIVVVVYFTYTTYLKNVEAAARQAELAQKHVEELSHHIAQQEKISRALKESEEYFRNAFDHAAGMALISPNGQWLQINESLREMLGYSEAELALCNMQAITHSDDLGEDLVNIYQLIEGKIQSYQLEKRYLHKDGHPIWVLQSASLIRDEQGNPRHLIFQIQDISDKKRAEEQIHYAAFHDALTGLPNRTLLADRLSMAIERARRASSYRFAVLFVDLDRFKIVNDSLGHDTGDKLLVDLSRRLEQCVRKVDTVARLGGDEFAVLLDGITEHDNAIEIAERIQESLKEPFLFDDQEFFTTASIGIAFSDMNYERSEDILRDADTAMYRAKANGKARFEIFDSGMHTRAVEALKIENELRRAIENGELVSYYQPIVSLRTGEIVGFESLARWNHPTRGLIFPSEFISLAEETGLIVPLGISMLRQSCQQTVQWMRESCASKPLSISVNLSGKQLKKPNLVGEIREILRETEISPSQLRLEITESILMEDVAAAIEMLNQLKSLGVQLSIDDFGTGYSSLSYLHRIPFDTIKIDRSFVTRMMSDKESRSIVKTIMTLALELEKEVIAEGVELEEHREFLAQLSCQYGQGYLFSKPVDVAEAEKLLLQFNQPKEKKPISYMQDYRRNERFVRTA
jgi:diguanylate cyclase (GGDEF)-like protein/PAS domain S-box-containing protein